MDSLLDIVENELQIAALVAMALLYAMRVRWLMSLPSAKELARSKNSPVKGIILSFGSVLTPWFDTGARKRLVIFTEFALFHIAVTVAIAYSFIHPYGSHLLVTAVTYTFSVLLGFGVLSGTLRLITRITRPDLRAISTPDDYFSISLLTVFLLLALLALAVDSSLILIMFFIVTAFLLVYIPMSKISHYLYILFTRFFFGFYFGRRGVIARNKVMEV